MRNFFMAVAFLCRGFSKPGTGLLPHSFTLVHRAPQAPSPRWGLLVCADGYPYARLVYLGRVTTRTYRWRADDGEHQLRLVPVPGTEGARIERAQGGVPRGALAWPDAAPERVLAPQISSQKTIGSSPI